MGSNSNLGARDKGQEMIRPSKEQYLLEVALVISRRSTCPDMQVGCIIATADGYILATGYNGSPKGWRHCGETMHGKCADNGPEHAVVHAEANAVAMAAKQGICLNGATAYITYRPCLKCEMLLIQAGIMKIVSAS